MVGVSVDICAMFGISVILGIQNSRYQRWDKRRSATVGNPISRQGESHPIVKWSNGLPNVILLLNLVSAIFKLNSFTIHVSVCNRQISLS